MTTVKVIKKFINVLPIQDLIKKTDSLVDTICFKLDNYIDGIDFKDWVWYLYYKTSLDDGYLTRLESEYDDESHTLTLTWVPTFEISSNTGYLTIQLRGKKDTDAGLLKWNTSVATINIGRSLLANDSSISEDILEDYLDRFEQLVQGSVLDLKHITDLLNREIERSVREDASLQEQIDNIAQSIKNDIFWSDVKNKPFTYIGKGLIANDEDTLDVTVVEKSEDFATKYNLTEQARIRDSKDLSNYITTFRTGIYSTIIGDGINRRFVIPHNLNTQKLILQVWGLNEEIPSYVANYINDDEIEIEFNLTLLKNSTTVLISAIEFDDNYKVPWKNVSNVRYISYENMMNILEGKYLNREKMLAVLEERYD